MGRSGEQRTNLREVFRTSRGLEPDNIRRRWLYHQDSSGWFQRRCSWYQVGVEGHAKPVIFVQLGNLTPPGCTWRTNDGRSRETAPQATCRRRRRRRHSRFWDQLPVAYAQAGIQHYIPFSDRYFLTDDVASVPSTERLVPVAPTKPATPRMKVHPDPPGRHPPLRHPVPVPKWLLYPVVQSLHEDVAGRPQCITFDAWRSVISRVNSGQASSGQLSSAVCQLNIRRQNTE